MPSAADRGSSSRASSIEGAKPGSSAMGCFMRGKGAFLLLTAIAIAVVGMIVLSMLSDNLRKEPDLAKQIGPFARWMIANRSLMPFAVAPVAIYAGWLLFKPASSKKANGTARRAMPWIATALASLWLLAIFGAILITFVMFLAPLYTYQEL